MKCTCCIFDLDGTLLDTLTDLKNSVNYALKQYDFPERTLDEVKSFIGDGIYLLMKRSVPWDTDDDTVNNALTVFKEYYSCHMNDNTCPYANIIPMLEKLKEKGIKTGVVTNKFHQAAHDLIKKHFGNLIDVTVGQKPYVPTKPDPMSLNCVMKNLGSNKENVLYFGDSDVDIITARNAGIKSVGVTWGFREKEVLQRTGADFIVNTPQEIIALLG